MAQTNVNIRMDEDLKREFDSLCNDMGLTMTTAFTVFARTVVRRQRIPFEIAVDAPNAETMAAMDEVRAMRKDPGKRLYGSFGELLKEVEADV
jgi:DNA-damage-inducible protein J